MAVFHKQDAASTCSVAKCISWNPASPHPRMHVLLETGAPYPEVGSLQNGLCRYVE